MPNDFFTGLKFLSLAIGSISGIVGLFVDFRDKHTKKITKGGYAIVGLIVFTGTLALILQYRDIQVDRDKTTVENEKYKTQIGLIQEQLKQNDIVLKDVDRSMNPFRDISLKLSFEIPLSTLDSLVHDPSYLHYRHRIYAADEDAFNRHTEGFFFDEQKKLFPDPQREKFMNDLLSNYFVEINIYHQFDLNAYEHGPETPGDANLQLFFLKGRLATNEWRNFYYTRHDNAIEVWMNKDVPTNMLHTPGKMESMLDLARCSMIFRLGIASRLESISNADLSAIFHSIHLRYLDFTCNGHQMHIENLRPLYYNSSRMYYYFRFPNALADLSKVTSVDN
jgi:hypothetical protein